MIYKILNNLVFMDRDLNFNTSQTQGQVDNIVYYKKMLTVTLFYLSHYLVE